MTLYKLTDQDGKTRAGQAGETQWGLGVKHEATGKPGQDLCTDGWIHAYEHPLLALLMNPIHAKICNPRLWECEGQIGKREGQLKCGCRTLTTVREIALPEITTEQRVRFAIACAWPTCQIAEWRTWARKWLTGKDRTAEAAWAAVWAAETAWAAEAAWAAAWAAAAAAEWAAAAVWAAEAAVWARKVRANLDLIRIAEWAVTDQPIEALYSEVAK